MLPRRTLLAITAVLDVALLARSRPLPSKTLAARYDLAPRQFESLLQDLVRADLLKSARGPRGGYELARERRRISLGDIVRALDEVKRDGKARATAEGRTVGAVIWPAIAAAADAFLLQLDQVSIEDLCRTTEGLGTDTGAREGDFAI